MCASELGIDPYTRAASDVYQDLFGEGSFIGKGIYEVIPSNVRSAAPSPTIGSSATIP